MSELKLLAVWRVGFSHQLPDQRYRANDSKMIITDNAVRAVELATEGCKDVVVTSIIRQGPIDTKRNAILDPLLVNESNQPKED
jgi:hypothetical protein